MLRNILAVIGGYVIIALLVMVGLTAAWFAMGGVDAVFREGSWDPAAGFLVVELVLGFAAAIVGGWVAALIAHRGSGAPMVLAIIVLVAGLASSIYTYSAAPAEGSAPPAEVVEREKAELSFMEAGSRAQEHGRSPAWSLVLTPLVGFAGVALGARLRRRQAPEMD